MYPRDPAGVARRRRCPCRRRDRRRSAFRSVSVRCQPPHAVRGGTATKIGLLNGQAGPVNHGNPVLDKSRSHRNALHTVCLIALAYRVVAFSGEGPPGHWRSARKPREVRVARRKRYAATDTGCLP
ncbi:protein of unknown function [Pararobbsia alpina]